MSMTSQEVTMMSETDTCKTCRFWADQKPGDRHSLCQNTQGPWLGMRTSDISTCNFHGRNGANDESEDLMDYRAW